MTEPMNMTDPMTFEGALMELESIVKKLDQNQVALGELVQFYARAQQLKTFCEGELQKAKGIIDQINTPIPSDG